MERVDNGEYANWTTHPNNPARVDVAEGAPSETTEAAAETAAQAEAPAHAARAA
jgi:dihydropyrimidine dehydrogenase (NAD+) subunit PreA